MLPVWLLNGDFEAEKFLAETLYQRLSKFHLSRYKIFKRREQVQVGRSFRKCIQKALEIILIEFIEFNRKFKKLKENTHLGHFPARWTAAGWPDRSGWCGPDSLRRYAVDSHRTR